VEGCREVTIKGAVPEHKALVRFVDREHDLAIIETDTPPPEFAPLRYNIDDLRTGDKVMIIGYPGAAGAHGEYTVATAQVEDIKIDEENKNKWLFISDVVDHGDSGGPVFDTSGNVIGVVVAKATVTVANAVTHEKISEQKAGVVIPLKTLGKFLFSNGVFSALSGSGVIFNDSYLEQRARNYIVNVQCLIKN
jgi:S1-C subfamily serine protease